VILVTLLAALIVAAALAIAVAIDGHRAPVQVHVRARRASRRER
jgi:hypothetical protein